MHRLESLLSRGIPRVGLSLLKRSRLLTRAAWRALRLYQDATGAAPNERRQLEEMEPAPASPTPAPARALPTRPDSAAGRVLIFSVRGWTTHLAWESTVARALRVRGADTLNVVCDRVLPACEPRTVVDDFASTCDRCVAQSRGVLDRTGLDYAWLSAYLAPGARERAVATTADLSWDELRTFEARPGHLPGPTPEPESRSGAGPTVPVGSLVGASVNRHLMAGDAAGPPSPGRIETYRRFVTAGLVALEAVTVLLDDYEPDSILLLNGLFFAEAILMHVAKARGIPVVAYERGKKVDSLVFARDESVVQQRFEEEWPEWRDRPLTGAQHHALDEYLEARFSGNVGIERLWPEQTRDAGGPADGPAAVLFTNVLWDTAVYDSDVAFPSMSDWVLHTVDWFRSRPELRLVVRIHPAEVRVPFKRSRDPVLDRIRRGVERLPDNVRVVAPEETVDSYALLDRARVVLAYASTIGLEAALSGVPCVVAGSTHYRGKGFTLDVASAEEYDTALTDAIAGRRMAPEDVETARRYAYFYFFRQTVPFPLVHEAPRSYVTFRYRRNAELAPGRDPSLDAICAALLEGGPTVNPLA